MWSKMKVALNKVVFNDLKLKTSDQKQELTMLYIFLPALGPQYEYAPMTKLYAT